MALKTANSLKLGAFVLVGLGFLILALYMIGKNRNLLGSNFILKARFENVNGLVPGNNVRFAGIEVGTVKQVRLVSDTLIEVTMAIDRNMMTVLHKNAQVSIGTEGLIGNKVVNIIAVKEAAALVEEGDVLEARRDIDPDAMLRTLDRTNTNIAALVGDLRVTVQRVSSSTELFNLLNDKVLAANVRGSLANLHETASQAAGIMRDLHATLDGVREGQGTLGTLLTDTTLAYQLEQAILRLHVIENTVDTLANGLSQIVEGIENDIRNGPGPVHTLLQDSIMALRLNQSVENIEKGTAAFSVNMEALQSNFLFRPYFKKQEKKKRKEQLKR